MIIIIGLLFIIFVFDLILHPYLFGPNNKYINYDPYLIEDNLDKILPNYYFDMRLLNNYYFLGVISAIVFLLDFNLLKSFLLSRLIRIIAIYLIKIPNPNPRAHLKRNRIHDLIISGHTIHWNLIFIYFIKNFNWVCYSSLFIILILYYLYLIKEKHHYSIDIFFGIYVSYTSYLLFKNNIL